MTRPAIDFLTFRLDVLSDQAKQIASNVYEQACGVSLRELRILRQAYHRPGITQSEVAAGAYLEKTLVSKLVTALSRRGLLVRRIGEEDARWVQLFLTEEGTSIVKQCNKLGRRMERSMLSVLTAEETVLFEQCLAALTAKVEQELKASKAPAR
jgi:MarR family transcriptional regulator, temperature-dependent positive regulator of motility